MTPRWWDAAGSQRGSMRPILVLGTTTLILAGIVPRFYNAQPCRSIAPPAAAIPADTVAVAPRSVTIRQGDGGHVHLEALIDGQRMQFMLDTGATGVAMRESDAASIGIYPTFRDYATRPITASGIVRVAPVLLD
jgi:aspartyl protease family protein